MRTRRLYHCTGGSSNAMIPSPPGPLSTRRKGRTPCAPKGDFLQKGLDAFGGVHNVAGGLTVNALEEANQHVLAPRLDEGADAQRDHGPHTIRPADGGDQLGVEFCTNVVYCLQSLSLRVADHRHHRGVEGGGIES